MKMDDNLNGEFGDVKLEEDSGRDDMFVDAPDELSSYDGRKTDNREEMEVTSKAYEGSDEMHNIQETHFQISDNNEHQIHQLKGELSNLRAMLEKTAAEKETMAQGYKVGYLQTLCSFLFLLMKYSFDLRDAERKRGIRERTCRAS